MLPLRETKMDKISQSSDNATPIRAESTSLSARTLGKDSITGSDKQRYIDGGINRGEAEETATNEPVPAEEASSGELGKEGIGGSIKKRTWRKPKDKPKRPLSSYNIFFQHQRERIVEGKTGEASPEEIVQSVEAILTRPATKRRHRKSHGRISFGDLARTIAENWKSVSPKAKSIFEHYAERDSLRYKRELKVWKVRKDLEVEATTLAKHSNFINSMNMSSSMRSEGSTTSEYLESLPREGSYSQHSTSYSNPVKSISSSFNSSMDSVSFHMPLAEQQAFQRQQQLLQQQLRMENNLNPGAGFPAVSFGGRSHGDNMSLGPGSSALHTSMASLPARMSTVGSGMEAMVRSGFGNFSGFGGVGDGPGNNLPTGDVDPLLGTSSVQGGFGGMQPGSRHMRVASEGQGRAGMGVGSMGSMMGHASLGDGFSSLQPETHQQQQQQNMMSPNMMGMMNQYQQTPDIDHMQQRLHFLQEQQRRLQMQQHPTLHLGGMQQFGPMSATSNHDSQMDIMGSGHVVSDRSQSDNNASYSTFTSASVHGVGFGGAGGSNLARSGNHLPMQQLQSQQFLVGGNVDAMTASMAGMSGSGRGSGPMNISNSSASLEQQHHVQQSQPNPMNDFMANQGFMDGGRNNRNSGGF